MTRAHSTRMPMVVTQPADATSGPRATGFTAQVLGQANARRGLRGGRPVLQGARTAYLSTQWRGEDDRRPSPGLLRRVSA